jgi:hypothetical protein
MEMPNGWKRLLTKLNSIENPYEPQISDERVALNLIKVMAEALEITECLMPGPCDGKHNTCLPCAALRDFKEWK